MMKVYKILPESEIFSNASPEKFRTTYEAEITLQTLKHLQEISPDFYGEFLVFILFNAGVNISSWDIENFSSKKKIFIIFDENGRVPTELFEHKSNVVFHAYLSFAESDRPYSNLFHYPLGCNSFVPEASYIPFSERKLNVFYSGNLHVGRKKLYQELTHLYLLPFPILARGKNLFKTVFDDKFPASYIRFTTGFSQGFTFTEYSNQLSNSRIILSPPGISNLECFRHYEGLRAGCVVIAERLPDKPQLKDSPIIEVKNWSAGFKIISELLLDPEKLDDLSRKSFTWYRDYLSPKPVSNYIFETLKTVKKRILN